MSGTRASGGRRDRRVVGPRARPRPRRHADVELCAIVGRSPERTERRAVEFGDDAIRRSRRDAGSGVARSRVALPAQRGPLRHDVARDPRRLPAAGREAARVRSGRSGSRSFSEAAAGDLFFAINFNHRYARPVQMAHAAITSGTLGDITFATWRFGGEQGTSRHPHANLIETQCHGFDMLEHLCGPIESVSAHMTDRDRERVHDDGRGADVRLRRGRLGSSDRTTRRTPIRRRTMSR